MKNLFSDLKSEGLSDVQIQQTFQILLTWLDEKYPVAGAVTRGWLKQHQDEIKFFEGSVRDCLCST